MLSKSEIVSFLLFLQLFGVLGSLNYEGVGAGSASVGTAARLVRKEERTPVVATEFGSISAVDIDDGIGRNYYHLQFITLEPNALFLPVLLHADMVFYVHTGSGRLSWTEGGDMNKVPLQRGDVYRLKSGTLFYLHSSLEPERPRFRIIAIFANPDEEDLQGPTYGPYSSISDLVRGFDKSVLQAAFQVPEEVIEELTSTTDSPAIVHGEQGSKKKFWEEELLFINAFFGIQRFSKQAAENKKKHTKTFNIFKEDPDFKSCSGWSKVVTKHDLHSLHGSQIGVYMVNLTKGSMMGPHWNPAATEVSVVLEGEGMVQVVCPSALTNKDCKNTKIRVEEGDVFTVPRFHPMAQTSFNNGSLVFMGFSTSSKKNHPQFLAGKASVLQTLDKLVLSVSFNVSNTTVGQLLDAQEESIILECTSCAENQEMVMEEEIERERQEERRKEEEEARRREEEERRREEEERKRQEEQQRKREEEERKRQEEEQRQRREEEERQRREEERRRQEEEEEEQRKREEKERKRQEEEERQRQEEEEERKREEEERRRQEEEEEEQRRRQQEEEERMRRKEEERQREEEERRRQEEEDERKQQDQEKEQRKRQQEEEERMRREEEERQTQHEQEEERTREEEQRRTEEEERMRQEEEEEQRQHEQEEEQRRRQQEQKRREEEEARQQQEQEQRRQEELERQKEEEQRQQEKEMEEERQREEAQRREQMQREEEARQEEEQREEARRRQEEEEAKAAKEHEEERRQEEERRRREERGRGEEESEQEIARREEEERVERQREDEEASTWRDVKLKTNKKTELLKQRVGLGLLGGQQREAKSDTHKQGRRK